MKSTYPLLLLLCIAFPLAGQTENHVNRAHYFTGNVTDVSGRPMSSINLYFRNGESNQTFRTDINGKFDVGLQPGNYEVEVNKTNSRSFHAFISITAEGPNPRDVTFVLDPDEACCTLANGTPYPKPVVLPRPPFPPAARAVRASGEVEVEVVVEPEGTVSAATARSGHPLLRAACVKTARSAKFEPVSTQEKRNLVLTFVFLDDDIEKAPARYKNAYRIEVVGEAMVLY